LQRRELARGGLALPHDKYTPAVAAKRAKILDVSVPIAGELRCPVGASCYGNATAPAVVHVPETTANVDDLESSGEDKIGTAGEIAIVKALAGAARVG
jgi:hypothetical protein